MEASPQPPMIKTRFLILSDTHGIEFQPEENPTQYADIAIHCGDLTEESKLEEYHASIRLLKAINTPLKLVIAGNHDFTLDIPAFRKKVTNAVPALESDLVQKEYGDYGNARKILEDASAAGIVFLDEGTHQFTLSNGAILTVYASPFTPSYGGDWGFQYTPSQGHEFEIRDNVDLVITHGPPKGILDYTDDKKRGGCPDLFAAIARARPRLHCFGHIHEGWGAKLVTWRDEIVDFPSHFTAINNERSVVVEKLSGLMESRFDTSQEREDKLKKRKHYRRERCCATSHCDGDANTLEFGEQTLFVNAAVQGTEEYPLQLPWLVDIELPVAQRGQKRKLDSSIEEESIVVQPEKKNMCVAQIKGDKQGATDSQETEGSIKDTKLTTS